MARQQNNSVAMLAALRESSKISGYYAAERRKVEIGVDRQALQAKFTAVSDAELVTIAEGGAEP